jgi:uncharacterized membrane protein (UPF0127 family)
MNRALPLLALLPLLLAPLSCSDTSARPRREPSKPPADGQVERLEQRGVVHVTTRDGRELRLEVEIASNDRDRARGLMFRKTMGEQAGMIFVFPEELPHSFWMKNTLLPLDMLFAAADGRIVGIVENAEPLTTTSRRVEDESKYVLEVNGGWCSRHGVTAGDRLRLEGMYRLE